MAQYGLGGYLYEVTTDGKTANYKFWDPQDATNLAEVALKAEDIPSGSAPDTREAAEAAFAKVSKQMHDARDNRVFKDDAKREADKQAEDKRTREVADEYLATVQDNTTQPVSVDKDGTQVFNTAPPVADASSDKKK